jgi:hypothetical protein
MAYDSVSGQEKDSVAEYNDKKDSSKVSLLKEVTVKGKKPFVQLFSR